MRSAARDGEKPLHRGGAALLAAGDTLARTLRAPIEMPVGPFMVLLGVPLFLWLLRKVVA